MNPIRLIAFDLDGTALLDDHIHEAPGLLPALEEAHRRGIYTVPVTGRPYGLLPPMFDKSRDWYSYGIFCSGGQTRNLKTGVILSNLTLSRQALELLCSQAETYGLAAEFCSDSRIYLTEDSWQLQRQDERLAFHVNTILRKKGVAVETLRTLLDQPVEKAHMNSVPLSLRPSLVADYEKMDLGVLWDDDGYGEITPREATKGQALSRLARQLQIPMESVLAIGDGGNDVSMLQSAGLGIAMGNAGPAALEAADVVTQRNDADGAAAAIWKYAL